MKLITIIVRATILLLILSELVYILVPRQTGAPRTPELMIALSNLARNPSPANHVAVEKSLAVSLHPIGPIELAMYAVFIFIFNVFLVFVFWKIGRKNRPPCG